MGPAERVRQRAVDQGESAAASRSWWDGVADEYYREHRAIVGVDVLMWGPEGVYESDLHLLGDVAGTDVLEFGAGAGQGSRWCVDHGARAVATDLSAAMLARGRTLDQEQGRVPTEEQEREPTDEPGRGSPRPGRPSYVQCDATRLPFADRSFDTAFSAYGALPFVADSAGLLTEVARVLRPGGRLVFSVTHPLRWSLPDVPGRAGLEVRRSYFDRRPYVEENAAGRATYVEHHRTIGDWVRQIVAAPLELREIVEPEWPEDRDHEWGGWSRLRGELVPGTAIFAAHRAG